MKKFILGLSIVMGIIFITSCSSGSGSSGTSTTSTTASTALTEEADILSAIANNEALIDQYQAELTALKKTAPSEATTCPTCEGNRSVVCGVCDGDWDAERFGFNDSSLSTEEKVAYILNGTGKCSSCTYGKVDCSTCGGSGSLSNSSYETDNAEYVQKVTALNEKIEALEAENTALRKQLPESSTQQTSQNDTYVYTDDNSYIYPSIDITYEKTEVVCVACSGSGGKTCIFCDGSGKDEKWYPGILGGDSYTVEIKCINCSGKGTTTCIYCGGDGMR